MQVKDFLKVYQRNEKYLVLNPLVPAWIVTNINGVLLIKVYTENQSLKNTIEEFKKYTRNISAQSVERFMNKVRGEGLFNVPAAPFIHKPYILRAVYLNMTPHCNLNCIYCFATEREENNFVMNLNDYQKRATKAPSFSYGDEVA